MKAIIRTFFKPVAILKYLFFPFMVAQSQDTSDLSKLLNNETVVAQAETQNAVWVGTDNGIYRINKTNGRVAHITTANSILPSNRIKGICVTKDENVYAATDKGIFRFDGYAYLLISTENANLPTNEFTSIACDEKGRIFLGTKSEGIVMMNNYRCQTFNMKNSDLTSNGVVNVYCDENGVIIGKLNNGNYVAMGFNVMLLINTDSSYNSNTIATRN